MKEKLLIRHFGILASALFLVVLSLLIKKVYADDFTFQNADIQKFKITVQNNATVQNNTQTISNTGGNTTISNGGSTSGNNGVTTGGASTNVQTGNAGSLTIICNDVNHTVINANSGQSCPSGSNPSPTSAPAPTATPTPGSSGCTSNCGGGSNNPGPSSSNGGPSGSSSPTQAVLGASTMAGTGTFEQNAMTSLFILGLIVLTAGWKSYLKDSEKSLHFC